MLSGPVQPLRARESRLFLDHAATPAKLGAAEGARHAIVVGRPLLTEDVDLISAFSGELLLLVPGRVHDPGRRAARSTLMRSVLHVASGLAAAGEGRRHADALARPGLRRGPRRGPRQRPTPRTAPT